MIRIVKTCGRQSRAIADVHQSHSRAADRGPGNGIVDDAVRVDRHIQGEQIAAFGYLNFVYTLLAIRKIRVRLTQQCRCRYGSGCTEAQRIHLACRIVGNNVGKQVVAIDIRNHGAYGLIIKQQFNEPAL